MRKHCPVCLHVNSHHKTCQHYGKPRCRRCRYKVASCARGLCWSCYTQYRAEFPSLSKYGRRTVASDVCGPSRHAAAPTSAPIGSAARIEEMTRRAARGESLFHADDSQEIQAALLDPFAGQTLTLAEIAAWAERVEGTAC